MSKLLWLPIDYPRLPIIDSLLNPLNLEEGFAFWQFTRLTTKQESPYDISDWKPWVRKKYPELIKWFGGLPFINLRNIKLNYQTTPVKAHIDFTDPSAEPGLWTNNHLNEPCGYRILVKGSRSNCLWVKEQRISCNLPDTTDVYILNHTTGVHGVNDDVNRWTIFCHAEIDIDRHHALLNKSLERYNEYGIWDNGI